MNIIDVDIKPFLCDYQLDLATENPKFTGSDDKDVQEVFDREIEGVWIHYQKRLNLRGINWCKEDFCVLLQDWYALTLDSAIHGYMVRKDGTMWKSKAAPRRYFQQKYNLDQFTFRSFEGAVEWNGPYS